MHLAQELLTNIQSSGGSRSFAKETRPLKMRNVVVAIRSWQWPTERIIEADPLIKMRSCWRTQCWSFYGHLAFGANWKGEKAQRVGALWADWKLKKKKSLFWSVIFLLYATTNHFSGCDVQGWKLDFKWQPVMTSSVVGPRRSSQALPKAKLAPKEVMVTVWWSAAHLIHLIH